MSTLEKIKAEIQKVLDAEGDSENARAQALALFWVLELFDKYAEQEPCEDAVSRQAVTDALLDYWHDIQFVDGCGYDVYEDCIAVINDLPSVQPKPETVTEFADRCRECGAKYGKLLKQVPKTGKWLKYSYARKCSECGSITCWTDDEGRDIPDNYCPNCGAKMVEPQESE